MQNTPKAGHPWVTRVTPPADAAGEGLIGEKVATKPVSPPADAAGEGLIGEKVTTEPYSPPADGSDGSDGFKINAPKPVSRAAIKNVLETPTILSTHTPADGSDESDGHN